MIAQCSHVGMSLGVWTKRDLRGIFYPQYSIPSRPKPVVEKVANGLSPKLCSLRQEAHSARPGSAELRMSEAADNCILRLKETRCNHRYAGWLKIRAEQALAVDHFPSTKEV